MKTCKYCKEEIHDDARICKHCGRNQKGFLNIIKDISDTAIILTFGLFIISILQYIDSRNERINAKDAFETAKQVKIDAESLYIKVNSIKRDLDSILLFTNRTGLLSIQNAWIQANTPLMGMTPNRPSVKRFEQNTSELIRLIIPDSISREKWWNETDQLLKQY
jgi:hypothetical protein